MKAELQDTAARLIAELPEDARDVQRSQAKRIRNLRMRILDMMDDYLADEELVGSERPERRLLDAQRAAVALEGWEERSAYWDMVASGEEIHKWR